LFEIYVKRPIFLKKQPGGRGGSQDPQNPLRDSHPESSHFVGPPTKYQLSYFDLTVQLVIFQKKSINNTVIIHFHHASKVGKPHP